MFPSKEPYLSSRTGKYRWEDFLSLDEDDPRELVDGELVEIDVPTKIHEWIVATLIRYLGAWAIANKAGIVLTSSYKIKIRQDRGVMPDVQFYRKGGRPIPQQGLESGAPDLAVEVISPTSGRYDRVEKLNWYASIGVPEYWLVDPERQTLERFVLLGPSDGYRLANSLGGDSMFAPESFPGLSISLAELWQLPEWFGN